MASAVSASGRRERKSVPEGVVVRPSRFLSNICKHLGDKPEPALGDRSYISRLTPAQPLNSSTARTVSASQVSKSPSHKTGHHTGAHTRRQPQWVVPPPAPSLMPPSGQALHQQPLQRAELCAAGEFPGHRAQRCPRKEQRALGEPAPTCVTEPATESLEVTAGRGRTVGLP